LVLRPTVAKAEIVSNSTRSSDSPLICNRMKAETETRVAPATMTEMATRMVPSGIVRP
jgi:hypothetical protein